MDFSVCLVVWAATAEGTGTGAIGPPVARGRSLSKLCDKCGNRVDHKTRIGRNPHRGLFNSSGAFFLIPGNASPEFIARKRAVAPSAM